MTESFQPKDKVWFAAGTHSNEIGIIELYWGDGWYVVKAVDKEDKLYICYLTDIIKF